MSCFFLEILFPNQSHCGSCSAIGFVGLLGKIGALRDAWDVVPLKYMEYGFGYIIIGDPHIPHILSTSGGLYVRILKGAPGSY